ncbi:MULTISPECIES: FTR1 family protein [unclassified Bradyrhizobium]|uniref:FTR1 family iron permease n=1 Tax=unclassified Bradyrhizobium TaxID=2631580 RepID=UPI000412C227|nr:MULTISPECIES: FTR1 family protein [unclassified Bradyrhizobium]MCP3462071.1 FTR1 family protein [Bradyrhizobium sp. CCGUVB23]
MLAALIIVFREVFEAGLIIGIVLAVTRSVKRRNRWIAGGVLAGVLGACVVAAFAGALSQLFEGMGQELFNAAILGVAVVMLTWHNVWMARHGKEMAGELRAVGQAVAEGSKSLLALAVVVGVAVLREGSEVALFLYGVAASDGGSAMSLLVGGLLGLVLGGAVCLFTYFGLLRIPPRALFTTTTVLITLLAAGMAAQAVSFLERANWLTALDTVVWDTSWLLSEDSILGRTLHTLIGYTDQPTGMQLVIYAAVVLVTIALMRLVGSEPPRHAVAAG